MVGSRSRGAGGPFKFVLSCHLRRTNVYNRRKGRARLSLSNACRSTSGRAAALLEEGEDSEAAEHARAIERAAAFCEREAYDITAAFDEADTPRAKRHQVSPHVRGFCRRLAEAMRYIYGDASYGTVASIATPAFDRTDISKEHVRYWCK